MSTAQIQLRIVFALALSLIGHAFAVAMFLSFTHEAPQAEQVLPLRLHATTVLAPMVRSPRNAVSSGSPRSAHNDRKTPRNDGKTPADLVIANESEPIQVSDSSGSPRTDMLVIKRIEPIYTERARRNGIEGRVVLEALVGLDGRVKSARIKHGLGYGLDEACLEAIAQSTFAVATDTFGKPREDLVVYTYRFQLLNPK